MFSLFFIHHSLLDLAVDVSNRFGQRFEFSSLKPGMKTVVTLDQFGENIQDTFFGVIRSKYSS
jgi:hypothetical protein